jgi:SHC-transforming protein 1
MIETHVQVRTRDRQFDSVPHLVDYHVKNKIPITSPESALLLRRAIPHSPPQTTV